MVTRRRVLAGSTLALGSGALPGLARAALNLPSELAQGVRDTAILDALPGKKPLIKLSWRPPNYETPVEYFRDVFTPNEAFFVRYHLADIPEVDPRTWKLRVGGEGASGTLELGLDELKRGFEQVELAAVCMCSGNRRGLFAPHVAGVQWGYGAMGNARWRGVRLKSVLEKVGLKKEAVEVVFDGADGPVLDKTPDFVKSIPLFKALDESTLIAWEMNGQPLPRWNGAPARVIVPGWTATYWMKHVTSIQVAAKPFDGFWMKSAYRIPRDRFPVVDRFVSQETAANTPITEMMPNSIITSHADGQQVPAGAPLMVKGIAWDGGFGLVRVEVSLDDGRAWREAELGPDHGRYSFREWGFEVAPPPGKAVVRARATNRAGQTQTAQLIQNPAGYHHNLMPRVTLQAV